MKATVKTDILKKSLSRLSIAAESRTNLPILGGVRIDAAWNSLCFSATNLDIFISDKIGATIQGDFSTVVNYRLLKNFVARATSIEVRFEMLDKTLLVAHGENEGHFQVMKVEEFPPDLEIEGDTISCATKDLVKPLQLIEHAMSGDESRYTLQGVNFHKNAASLEMAACDGSRLAVCESKEIKFDGEDIILPAIAVSAVTSLIEDGELEIKTDGKGIEIQNGNFTIQSRLIEGKFPDYTKAIPEKRDTAFSAEREELIHAIETASIFMERSEVAVRLKGTKKELEVGCAERFKTKLVGTELKGQCEVTKNTNYRYLLDAIKVCSGDDVRIEVSQDSPSLVFREGDYLEVVQCCATTT